MPDNKPLTQEEKEKQEALHLSVLKRTQELMTSALGLVAALAWNDAVQTLFKHFFGESNGLTAKFLYAVGLTVIIVYATTRLARVTKALEQRLTGTNKP